MYTEKILAKHHFSKKRRSKVTLTTHRILLEFNFSFVFLKPETNVHMYIQRPQNKNCKNDKKVEK